jgi:hypothetical protein
MSDTNTSPAAYVTREEWLNAFVDAARPIFESFDCPVPINTRVSVGFPSTGYKSPVIGECWSSEASADGHFEIFINPTTETDARIADIVTHELCHAALGTAEGHGKRFKALARSLGLEGKLTATVAGADWFAWAAPILEAIGPMPYAAIRGGMKPPRKKKQTFLLKVECPDCGLLARMTKSHILPHTHLNCMNPECDGIMIAHMGDEEGEGE